MRCQQRSHAPLEFVSTTLVISSFRGLCITVRKTQYNVYEIYISEVKDLYKPVQTTPDANGMRFHFHAFKA